MGDADQLDPRQADMRRDIQDFFDKRRQVTEPSPPPATGEDYSWQSPSSWGFMGKDTYAMNARPRKASLDRPVDTENLWALRVFKPVETSDGVMSKIVASSGYTYVTVSCDLECTALELCQMLMRKFTSQRDLSRFRLYVVQQGTERLLEHQDCPVKLLKRYLMSVGYTESDQLSKIAREDHSYCCRFIYREYPPPPPRSEDFTETPLGVTSKRPVSYRRPISMRMATAGASRAKITPKFAHLADVNLSVLPTVMFLYAKTLEYIDLSRNTLLTLPDDLFELLQSLRLLRLIGNRLSTLPKAVLACPSITHLDLSSNILNGDSLAVLADMPKLTHLNVSCNRIQDLPPCLGHLQSLRTLDLSSNCLKAIPSCIYEMGDLRELNVSFNRITEIPEDIVKIRLLKTLVLVGNGIEAIHDRMHELVHLRQCDLRGNLLRSVGGLGRISSLIEVSVDHNNLTNVGNPDWPQVTCLSCVSNALTGINVTDYLYSLRRLNVSYSRLVTLPEDLFTFMPNLDTLILNNNELTRLPQSINLLSKLEILCAHSNSLTEINLRFCLLPQLSQLNLCTNNIRSLTPDIWSAPSLRVLNISSNFLTGFPAAPLSLEALPLARSLEEFLAADNRLAEDVGEIIAHFTELRVLNLSYNRVFDLGDSLKNLVHLVELYLSGNAMTAFPDEIDQCRSLRMLFINGNKLANIPGELGKSEHLAVFDVQSNVLKYNISNWPYDWNWNFNTELQYLNLANNRKLDIKYPTNPCSGSMLVDFKSMGKLRLLDLSNVQVCPQCLPEGVTTLQTRLGREQAGLTVAVADYCGRDVTFDVSEFVRTCFMGQEKDHLVGLFDGRGHDYIPSYLNDTLEENLKMELRRMRQGEDFTAAIRRAFLATNRDLSLQPVDIHRGSTACLLYLLENQLIVANVGDTTAVLSKEGTAKVLTTRHHPWSRGEQARIRDLGGYISLQGLVEGDLNLTRAFGYHHLLPYVNANPSVAEVELGPTDEFVLVATWSFWKVMSYQMAVDIARKERSDPNVAVQMLRDMAIARGVTESMKIILVDFRGITTQAGAEGAVVERRKTAFRRDAFGDQVLSRLQDEIPPPKPPCAFVFTDIKDSTKLWSLLPSAMRVAIRQHNNIMRRLMRIHGGYEVKTEGDAFVAAFQSGVNAVKFCLAVQQQFLENDWPREILESPVASPVHSPEGHLLYRGLSIRMGIHFGMADDEEDKVARRMDYHGIHMIIAARVSALADGGQINITEAIWRELMALSEQERPDVAVFDLGMTQLKGLTNPEHVLAIYPQGLAERHRVRSDSVKSVASDGSGLLIPQLSALSFSTAECREGGSE